MNKTMKNQIKETKNLKIEIENLTEQIAKKKE